jgi:hypothetical protein
VLILAGMPDPISRAAQLEITSRFARWHVIHQPSPRNNDTTLYNDKVVYGLLEAVSSYAVRQQKRQPSLPTPKQILLAYVPSTDEERLLQAFDFFVFPVRLIKLAEYDVGRGRQFRHSQKFALDYIVQTLKGIIPIFEQLRSRLSTPGAREAFFLPPLNFHVSKESWVRERFLDIRRTANWMQDLTSSVRIKRLGEKQVLVDHRDLFFPVDRSAHGLARELLQNSSFDERRQFMQSNFRFGVRLLRDGLHHDVQYENKDLGGAIFQCCVQGTLSLDGTHANVYPDDRVLGKKMPRS